MTQITKYLYDLTVKQLGSQTYEAYNDSIYMELKLIEGELISHATYTQPAEYEDNYIEVIYIGLYDQCGELEEMQITEQIINEINRDIQL